LVKRAATPPFSASNVYMQYTDKDGEMPYLIFCNYNRVNKTKVNIACLSSYSSSICRRVS
jgi:hypothetical protein